VKQAQALGRELGSKYPKAALELLKELPGENGLYALLGILSGTGRLIVISGPSVLGRVLW